MGPSKIHVKILIITTGAQGQLIEINKTLKHGREKIDGVVGSLINHWQETLKLRTLLRKMAYESGRHC